MRLFTNYVQDSGVGKKEELFDTDDQKQPKATSSRFFNDKQPEKTSSAVAEPQKATVEVMMIKSMIDFVVQQYNVAADVLRMDDEEEEAYYLRLCNACCEAFSKGGKPGKKRKNKVDIGGSNKRVTRSTPKKSPSKTTSVKMEPVGEMEADEGNSSLDNNSVAGKEEKVDEAADDDVSGDDSQGIGQKDV